MDIVKYVLRAIDILRSFEFFVLTRLHHRSEGSNGIPLRFNFKDMTWNVCYSDDAESEEPWKLSFIDCFYYSIRHNGSSLNSIEAEIAGKILKEVFSKKGEKNCLSEYSLDKTEYIDLICEAQKMCKEKLPFWLR